MSDWTGRPGSLGTDDYLDGNALAGPLSEVFAIDITAALGTCSGCGTVRAIAEARRYVHAPAKLLRCPACDGVWLRLDERDGRVVVDFRGLTQLTIMLG